MSTAEIRAALSDLDTKSKLEVIDFLWSDLYGSFDSQGVSAEHKSMVREEYELYKQGQSKLQSWAEAKTEILSAIQNRGS